MLKQYLTNIFLIVITISAYCNDLSIQHEKKNLNQLISIDHQIDLSLSEENFSESKKYIIHGLNLAQQYGIDSSVSKYTYLLGHCYKSLSNFDSAIYYFNLFLKLPESQPNFSVNTQLELASSYENIGQMDSVFSIMKKLEFNQYLLHDSLSKEKIKFLMFSGILNEDKGNYEVALADYIRALKIAQKINDTMEIEENLINIGAFYFNIGNYQKCLEYYENAKIYLKHTGRIESLQACTTFRTMGLAYARTGKVDTGLKYANESIEIAKKLGIVKLMNFCYSGIATIYLEINDNNKAEYFYLQALDILKNSDLKFNQLTIYGQLGLVNYEQKKYQIAKSYFEKARQLATELGRLSSISSSYKDLAKTEAALGNYSKAYHYQEIYNSYKDSITSEISKKNLSEMEAKYQNEKKLQEISLLTEKTKSQLLEIKNKRQQQYILIAGLITVLIISSFVWREYKIKKKTNSDLARKNEEITLMNEKLNESNLSKTKLFSIISHDLRSPVTSLYQFLNLEKNNTDFADKSTLLKNRQIIEQSIENLAEVMEDLFIWSKSQMEHFELSIENLNIRALLEEIVQIHNIYAIQKNISVELECPDDLQFLTDANFIRIIARNLVSNAIKHSPENNKVDVSAKMNSGHFILSVKNNGKALSREQINDLNNWQKINNSSNGIGLKLTHEFIERLNGKLEVKSDSIFENEFIATLKSV